jgi:ABC-type sugar transport system permease subunit
VIEPAQKAAVLPGEQEKIIHARRRRRQNLEAYVYLAPALAFLLLTFVYPILAIIRLSLLRNNADGSQSISLLQYELVANDPIFWRAAGNNAQLLLSVPVLTGLALLIAILLFERVRGWRLYRSVIFFPYILAIPTVATAFIYVLGKNGIINALFEALRLGFLAQDWLGNQKYVILSIALVIMYRELGFGVVLFLARLMGLEKEILEAAEIDGANWWQRHIYITLPQLAAVIEFFVVVEVITMLSWVFSYVYSMTGGGPGHASTVIEFYIWRHGFAFRSPGIASAMAVILLLVTLLLIIIQMRVRRFSLEEV